MSGADVKAVADPSTEAVPVDKPAPAQRAIDRAKAHYNAQDRQHIPVPEWGLDIYARPMTFDDSARAMHIRGAEPKNWFAAVIITMAEDLEGKKLFSFTELNDLVTRVDGTVLTRIGMRITGDDVKAEDHEGN